MRPVGGGPAAASHPVSPSTVGRLLHAAGFSLQTPRKLMQGRAPHPDRDAQFQYIAARTAAAQAAHPPVISVDAKKKDLIGHFKTGGQAWQPVAQPERVPVYDFPSLAEGRATPYGIYDLSRNAGWCPSGATTTPPPPA